jgi:cytochrome c oxidase subunit 4
MTSRETFRSYTLVFLALMALLGLTYWLAHVDLGFLNTPLGLIIAAVKATLVALYFMHLHETRGLQRIAAALGVFWLGILIALSLTDYRSRDWLELPSPWPAATHSSDHRP